MRGRQKVLRLRDGPPSQRPLQNHFETSHKTIPPEEHLSVGFESQNPSFIQIEQPPDGSITVITAGVAESALLDNKNPKENSLLCSN